MADPVGSATGLAGSTQAQNSRKRGLYEQELKAAQADPNNPNVPEFLRRIWAREKEEEEARRAEQKRKEEGTLNHSHSAFRHSLEYQHAFQSSAGLFNVSIDHSLRMPPSKRNPCSFLSQLLPLPPPQHSPRARPPEPLIPQPKNLE